MSWAGVRPVGQQGGSGSSTGGEVGAVPKVAITGCKHDVVGPIIRGEYDMSSMNHGKPAYKKEAAGSQLAVMIYFWDERDGPANSGWWIGPQIGGNMVWGHHSNRAAATPPCSGWQAPHSAPADMTMVIAASVDKGSSPAGDKPNSSGAGGWQGSSQGSPGGWGQQSWGGGKWGSASSWKQMEDKKASYSMEAVQKKLEEQRKQQQDVQKKRLEDAQKAQVAQKAVAEIRRVVAKLRTATVQNFDELKTEVTQTLAKELEDCGPHGAKVQEECEKTLEQASAKIENFKKQIEAQEAKQKEMERQRQEMHDNAMALLKEVTEMLDEAEDVAKEYQDSVQGFLEEGSGKSKEQVVELVKASEHAGKLAEEKAVKCTEFLKEKGNAMKVIRPEVKKPISDGEEEKKSEEEQPTYQKSAMRMGLVRQKVEKMQKEFVTTKERALKRADANAAFKKMKAVFAKYDKDKDGMLNKKEIEAFAKGEYKFTLPADTLKLIFEAIVQDKADGVKLADFQRLKAATGVAREQAHDQKKRAAREKKEKDIADQKAEIQASIDEAVETAKVAEQQTAQACKEAVTILKEGEAMQSRAMLKRATEFEAVIVCAKEQLDAAQKGIADFGSGVTLEESLAPWLTSETMKLTNRVKNLTSSLSKAEGTLTKFNQEATVKDSAEVKVLSTKAMTLLKGYQSEKVLQAKDLFAEVDSKKSGSIEADALVAFMQKLQGEAAEKEKAEKEKAEEDDGAANKEKAEATEPLSEEDLGRVFAAWDDEEEGVLTEANFVGLLRELKKVAKDIVITTELSIKEGKTLRRLDVDEVIEVFEAAKEPTSEMKRVRARVAKDGIEGWVTLEGNQGTIFLKDGGGVYKVVKETILTEAFEIGAPKDETRKVKETTRKLKVGELVDVREWERKDDATGLTRMKCKVRQDGLVGYLTTIGNTGIRFVEPV